MQKQTHDKILKLERQINRVESILLVSVGALISGMAYVIEFVDSLLPEDKVFESHGIKILVDPKSLIYIDGTELDFVKEGLNEGFQFNNPNVKDSCGCGESFTV